jgi:hypothetical protein
LARLSVLTASLFSAALLTACAGDGGPPPEIAGGARADAAAPEPQVAALPPLPRIMVREVLGYSRSDLVNAFGAPAFRRVDKGAEILRFRGEDCLLDVFLYTDGKNARVRVAHVEARTAEGEPADRNACINRTPRARG